MLHLPLQHLRSRTHTNRKKKCQRCQKRVSSAALSGTLWPLISTHSVFVSDLILARHQKSVATSLSWATNLSWAVNLSSLCWAAWGPLRRTSPTTKSSSQRLWYSHITWLQIFIHRQFLNLFTMSRPASLCKAVWQGQRGAGFITNGPPTPTQPALVGVTQAEGTFTDSSSRYVSLFHPF